MRNWLAATLIVTLTAAASATGQSVSPDPIRITSAIYGGPEGSADVTPVVGTLLRPDLNEFYASPQWLKVDPSVGQTKQLVISYEYRGEPHVFTTTEPSGVSHRMLLEAADPSLRPARVGNPSDPAVIVAAYYGLGARFDQVTERAREVIRPGHEPIVVDGPVLGLRPAAANAVLILTFVQMGVRQTAVIWRGSRVSIDALVLPTSLDGSGLYSRVAPAWVSAARPDPPREPTVTGPGAGRSPRREVGISELFKAAGEFQAIPAYERSAGVTSALALVESALESARRDIGYPYPPSSQLPPAVAAAPAVHVAAAVRALNAAVTQFAAANPGRRGGGTLLAETLARIRGALAALPVAPDVSPAPLPTTVR